MTDRPIIFSAPMIRALLEGRKTQTRRLLKPQFPDAVNRVGHTCFTPDRHISGRGSHAGVEWFRKLPFAPGDRLWVRETFARAWETDGSGNPAAAEKTYYRADGEPFDSYEMPDGSVRAGIPWKSPIHMPRWASRLTLTVTDVRVQRLQEISEEDAVAEGVGLYVPGHGFITESELRADPGYSNFLAPRMGFEAVWSEIHGPDAWDANPWVAAIGFTVHRCNIDRMGNDRT